VLTTQNGTPIYIKNVATVHLGPGMGDYKAHLTPDMAGDWSVDLSYQGPKGPAKLKIPVNVKQ